MQRLLLGGVLRDVRIISRIAGHQQNIRLVGVGPAADIVEKAHRRGRVRQRRQPRVMQCGDQKAGRDRDRFRHIIILADNAVGAGAASRAEHADQPRRDFEKRLVRISPERLQRREPLRAGAAVIERALLILGGDADARLHRSVADDGEMPGLVIGPAGCRARRFEAGLDQRARDGRRREVAHGVATADRLVKRRGAPMHLVERQQGVVGQRDRLERGRRRFRHAAQAARTGRLRQHCDVARARGVAIG